MRSGGHCLIVAQDTGRASGTHAKSSPRDLPDIAESSLSHLALDALGRCQLTGRIGVFRRVSLKSADCERRRAIWPPWTSQIKHQEFLLLLSHSLNFTWMEESEIYLWGIVAVVAGSVITAAIIGTWNWASKKLDDKVRLSADVSMPGDWQVMQFIGCACMIVTVKCKGRRTAKISGALLAIEGIDLIPQFEKAFGAQFGYVPVDAGPPPALIIDLVPLRKPNCSDGFILERDDAIRFAMPIQVPILHKFPTAPLRGNALPGRSASLDCVATGGKASMVRRRATSGAAPDLQTVAFSCPSQNYAANKD